MGLNGTPSVQQMNRVYIRFNKKHLQLEVFTLPSSMQAYAIQCNLQTSQGWDRTLSFSSQKKLTKNMWEAGWSGKRDAPYII